MHCIIRNFAEILTFLINTTWATFWCHSLLGLATYSNYILLLYISNFHHSSAEFLIISFAKLLYVFSFLLYFVPLLHNTMPLCSLLVENDASFPSTSTLLMDFPTRQNIFSLFHYYLANFCRSYLLLLVSSYIQYIH